MTDELDRALRSALKPVEPPEGFTQRVMASVTTAQRHRSRAVWRVPLGFAAMLLLGVGIYVSVQRHHRQQLAGLEARREVIEALRLTDQKLDIAYQTVKDESGT